MTERLVIRSLDDFEAALPRLVPYAPRAGSVIVSTLTAKPVAIIQPDVIEGLRLDPEPNRAALRVFAQQVVVFVIGDAEAEVVVDVLDSVGATIVAVRPIPAERAYALFADLPFREDYAATNQHTLDEGYARAERVASGQEI